MLKQDLWQLYIIECENGALYTGITNNMLRRYQQHCTGKGAKYFRSTRPLRLIYQEFGFTRSEASSRESAIKRLSKQQKWQLIQQHSSEGGLR